MGSTLGTMSQEREPIVKDVDLTDHTDIGSAVAGDPVAANVQLSKRSIDRLALKRLVPL